LLVQKSGLQTVQHVVLKNNGVAHLFRHQLILDAAYEATQAAAFVNAGRTGNRVVYLTLLGGGVFGNRDHWIITAIKQAFHQHSRHGLDIRIVS